MAGLPSALGLKCTAQLGYTAVDQGVPSAYQHCAFKCAAKFRLNQYRSLHMDTCMCPDSGGLMLAFN